MIDWAAVTPALILASGAIAALLVTAFHATRTWRWPAIVSTVSLLAASAVAVATGSIDRLTLVLTLVVVFGTFMMVLAAGVMDHEESMPPGELHFLLLSSAAGGCCLVIARDLVTLVVALELLSLPSIALVGLRRSDLGAARAAWTFFLLSAVSTAVTVMGVSIVYGFAGNLAYDQVATALAGSTAPARAVAAAVLLTVVGLLFKAGAVPFHVWIPDTYRGASVPVAGYLSVVSKSAALGALLVVLTTAFGPVRDHWAPVVAVVAAVTMTVGNLGALGQRDAIGMLAWSSIAQAGFILAPLVGLPGTAAVAAAVSYLVVYSLANLVAFTTVAICRRRWGGTTFAHLAGLARRDPGAGICLAFALLVLAGFPPAVIGLLTKYVVLLPPVDSGYGWLAVVMALNVAIGLVYYLRLLATVLAPPSEEVATPPPSPSPPYTVRFARAAMIAATAALVAASVYPDLLLGVL